jgi:hypothetical protein
LKACARNKYSTRLQDSSKPTTQKLALFLELQTRKWGAVFLFSPQQSRHKEDKAPEIPLSFYSLSKDGIKIALA